MQVKVDQIKETGLEVNEPVAAELVSRTLTEDGRDTGFRASEGFALKATLHKVSGGVILRGNFEATVVAPCKRCLLEVPLSLPIDFTLSLVPRAALKTGDEDDAKKDDESKVRGGSFELKDADHEVYDGKTIDLEPIVREQLLLALPMNVVCRDTCEGLCSVCGQNLNEKQCGCERKVLDPRLMALKNIKIN
jgi:uncharacterized protein